MNAFVLMYAMLAYVVVVILVVSLGQRVQRRLTRGRRERSRQAQIARESCEASYREWERELHLSEQWLEGTRRRYEDAREDVRYARKCNAPYPDLRYRMDKEVLAAHDHLAAWALHREVLRDKRREYRRYDGTCIADS